MMTQAQTTKYAHKMLAYNKPSLMRTVVGSVAYFAVLLFLISVVGAAVTENESGEMTKSSTYLALLALGFIVFFSVKLLSGIAKYLRNL